VPDVFLVVVNVTLILAHIFHVGVAFGAVLSQVAFVLPLFSPILGESSGIAGALIACNLSLVPVHFAAVVVDVFLILLYIANVLVAVAPIMAQIAAILVKVFPIFWNVGRMANASAPASTTIHTQCFVICLSLSFLPTWA
jgi:hypothetical protein